MSQVQLNAEMRSVTNSACKTQIFHLFWKPPPTHTGNGSTRILVLMFTYTWFQFPWSLRIQQTPPELIKTKQYSDFIFVLIFRLSPGTRQAMWWSNYEGKLPACFRWDPASSFSRFGNELNWGGWSILVTQLVWVIQSICFLNVICWCLSLKHATLTWKERHRIQYSSLSTVIKYST